MGCVGDDLDIDAYLGMCHQRTELRDGDYPPLIETELAAKAEFVGLLTKLAELAGSALAVAAPKAAMVFKKAFSDDDY